MIAVMMGVSGSGKTTVGRVVASQLGWRFLEGDSFHPEANVTKMAAGTPLTDVDRWPWLEAIRAELEVIAGRGEQAVLACSALKEAYRQRLAAAGDVCFVYLKGDRETIGARIAQRRGHYMPPSLLDSQFATLEEPQEALVVDVTLPLDAQVATVCEALDSGTARR
ncbi:MAG: gluconokinase [Casimicrobiaceae bacterium]